MKAYVLYGIGDLRYEDVPIPVLQPGWALVKVLAAGICSSDIPRIFEKGTYHFPTIPGHEFCGVVEKVHDRENENWLGKRVGVYPLIPCMKCSSCAREEYETCKNYDYIGSRRDGAFAEFVAVPVWNLIELPDEVSDVEGAMLEPAAVAMHAVRRLGNLTGKSVCVVGTGAIGFLAGQWVKLLGAARVVIKGRDEAKKEIAECCNLEYTIECNGMFDCVIEAVGSQEALAESIAWTNSNGHLVLMGNPKGDINLTQDVYWQLLRKQITATGTWNSSFGKKGSDWEMAVETLKAGRLDVQNVISHELEQERLFDGLKIMRDRLESHVKLIARFFC